jgi:hypothetical protein
MSAYLRILPGSLDVLDEAIKIYWIQIEDKRFSEAVDTLELIHEIRMDLIKHVNRRAN